MPYKLLYFAVRGKCHHVRYMIYDNGIDVDEPRIAFDDWKDMKPKMRFGQLPAFVDGDFEIVQSGAIARYIARKHNLYGKNEKEAALIDMIHDGMVDLRDKTLKLVFSQGDFDAEKKEYVKNQPAELARFEKLLKENNGGQGFFVGDKVSLADYCIFDLLINQSKFVPGCLDDFPLLKQFVERMSARPNLAKYMSSEKHTSIPITPKDRLQ